MIEAFKILWNLILNKYKFKLLSISFLIITSTTCSYIVPIIIWNMINFYTSWDYALKTSNNFWLYITSISIVLLIWSVTYHYWRYLTWILKIELPVKLNKILVSNFLDTKINKLKNENILVFTEIINNAKITLKDLIEDFSKIILRDIFTIFIWTIIMFFIDKTIWLIFLCYIIVLISIHSFYNVKINKSFSWIISSNEENISKIIEWLLNFKTIRYLWLKNNILDNIEKSWEKYLGESKKIILFSRIKWLNFSIISTIFLTLWYSYIWYWILNWFVQVWTIIIFSTYFPNLRSSLDSFLSQYEDLISYKHNTLRIKKILNLEKIKENSLVIKNNYKTIKLENLNFWYNENKNILKNINIEIKEKEKIAILWKSWSWKSTFLELLTWNYENYKWKITFNWKELKKINLINHLEKVVYLPQFTELFNDNIKNNISIVWENNLEKAIELSNSKFIYNLPDWLETIIWNKWHNISGWENQRIWIARIFMKNKSSVYLFDESCSNLDHKNNALIISNLLEELKDKIIIYVTHKITDTQNFDRVIFFRDWEIIYDWEPNLEKLNSL